MQNEVFRFLLTRPVQRGSSIKTKSSFNAYARTGATAFVKSLQGVSDAKQIATLATAQIKETGTEIDRQSATARFIAGLDEEFRSSRRTVNVKELVVRLATTSGLGDLADTRSQAQLLAWTGDLSDGLLAAALAGGAVGPDAAERVRLLRVAEIVHRTMAGETFSRAELRRALRARPLLPAIRPSQHASAATATPMLKPAATTPPSGTAAIPIENITATIDELRRLSRDQSFLAETKAPSADEPRPRSFFSWGRRREPAPPPTRILWSDHVSTRAKQAIADAGVSIATTTLDDAIQSLERVVLQRTSVKPPTGARMKAQRMGSGIGSGMPSGKLGPTVIGKKPDGDLDSGPAQLGLNHDPTVPKGVGKMSQKRRGDLFIVRQTLDRYELGEIAHIENILKGESNKRTFKRSQTTEETVVHTEETTLTEEKDLQSTERFELGAQSKEAIKDDLKLEAGFSVTASYGPTVGIEAGTQFAYEHAQEKSKESASKYAREVTNRAQSKLETRVSEQRTTRLIRQVEELSEHSVINAGGLGHIQGVYRWVEKVYEAQLVNYGIRDLYDFYIPEPAAFYRSIQADRDVEGVAMDCPEFPMSGDRPLWASDLNRENYTDWVARYAAADVQAPPPLSLNVSGVIEKGASQGDDPSGPGSKVSSELVVPEGYSTKTIKVNGYGYQHDDETNWVILISGRQFTRGSADGESKEFGGRSGTVPLGLLHYGYSALSVAISLNCECLPVTLEKWQLQTFNAVMQGYQRLKSAYDEQLAAARDSISASIHGRNPQANDKIIRDELKRAVITVMTGQRFELFDSMRGSVPPFNFPEIALADAEAEGRYVAFTEQAFEWENMTFLFYPYFWGKKSEWPSVSQLEDNDYLFEQFLKAGFSRVQVPVRPGFESRVDYVFDPSNPSGNVWAGEDPPGFESDGLSIEDEMRFQTGGANFVQGPGFVTITAGSDIVTGTDTDFSSDDLDRELRVGDTTLRIIEVVDPTQVRVAEPRPAAGVANAQYALGAKLAGPPWEITVPTTLVYLQPDANLNP
jgi:hypothetical protein